MQTYVFQQKNVTAKRMQLCSLVTWIVLCCTYTPLYTRAILSLQATPQTASELVDACKAEQVMIQLATVCSSIDKVCFWEESNSSSRNSSAESGGNISSANQYESCFLLEAVKKIEEKAIAVATADTWWSLQLIIVFVCFTQTITQWYCGIFASTQSNKVLTTLYVITNAMGVGYSLRETINAENRLFLIPCVFHLICAWIGASLLQRQAQVVVLPPASSGAMLGAALGIASAQKNALQQLV